jgi:hypothetical protein
MMRGRSFAIKGGIRGRRFACNSALVYTLEKYGQSDWTFEPGYPHLDRIVLYEQQIEVLTGKHSEGLYH